MEETCSARGIESLPTSTTWTEGVTERRSGVGSADTRATELGEMSWGLEMLASALLGRVIAGAVNRSVEQRSDKRPLMFDLRESEMHRW